MCKKRQRHQIFRLILNSHHSVVKKEIRERDEYLKGRGTMGQLREREGQLGIGKGEEIDQIMSKYGHDKTKRGRDLPGPSPSHFPSMLKTGCHC